MPFCVTGPASIEIPGITIDTTTAGATFEVVKPIPTVLKFNSGWFKTTGCCQWYGTAVWKVTTTDKTPFPYLDSNVVFDRDFWVDNGDGTFSIYITMYFLFHWPFFYSNGGGLGNEVELVAIRAYGDGIRTNGFGQPEAFYASDLLSACQDVFTLNKCGAARTSLSPCEVSPELDPPPFPFTFGAGPLTATALAGDGGTGPETGDTTRGKFRLEYDIPTATFTIHSFERVLYPKWTLVDSDPCTGYTKMLLLSSPGDAADGCGVAPSEVTITRVCPPDRVGKSALLEDRKPNGATGKTKRQCGCDCQDEVDDRRHTCATKCESAATEGCENIDPAPDDITCRYPEAINCCENTAGKDVPCAYVVEFECDLFFDIESVRHKIAAKQVVMRRECYFEDGCEFVAAGPESSTGGSPVMDVDGFPGAQPVCASCEDLCLTGCTWSAWTVAECPYTCDSLGYSDIVQSRIGKCLELTWGEIDASFTTCYAYAPPGYSLGGTITRLKHTATTGAVWTFEDIDNNGWAGTGGSSMFNDQGGCGYMGITPPFTVPVSGASCRWLAGNCDGYGHCGSRTPFAANPVRLILAFLNNCLPRPATITIFARWIDCP
jgi:hypothetical protein